jgi:hypothetical protein
VSSPLERLALLSPLIAPRIGPSRHRAIAPEPIHAGPVRLHLGSKLPLNLRSFLACHLGPEVRVEEDTIVALGERSSEKVMRELARAIRRFSAVRAREAWSECAIALERLERDFQSLDAGERGPIVLCLRCARIDPGSFEQHRDGDCLAVDLGAQLEASRNGAAREPLGDTLHRAVERFRRERAATNRDHFELDCYVANQQVVFSWRPLPGPDH